MKKNIFIGIIIFWLFLLVLWGCKKDENIKKSFFNHQSHYKIWSWIAEPKFLNWIWSGWWKGDWWWDFK